MMVGLVIGIRQNGWDGAKKNEYGGQSRGGLVRHFSFSLLKSTFVQGRSQQAPLIPANKQKAHFCDRHHIASATAELFRRNCKMSAKQNKLARLCASKLLLTPVRRI